MTEVKRPLITDNSLLIREYIEVRLNLLIVANDKLEIELNRRFNAIDASTGLAAKGVDERFKHLEQIVVLGQETSKRAVDKAESAQAAHNVAANEWRGTLNDFKSTLVGRAEFDKLYGEFSSNKLEVSKIIAAQSGKTSVVDPQMHELISEVKRLASANENRKGVGEGISSTTGIIIVVVTLIIAALGVFVSTRNGAPVVVAVPAQVAPVATPQVIVK